MRFTIARCMAATAILALNISLIRAYLLAEGAGQHLDLADSGFLMCFALQIGLWRFLYTAGRRRWFWMGFEVCGLAAILAVGTFALTDLGDWYAGEMTDLAYLCLPRRVDIVLSHEHWDWFLAIIYFLPEMLAAVIGGLLAACLFGVRLPRSIQHA